MKVYVRLVHSAKWPSYMLRIILDLVSKLIKVINDTIRQKMQGKQNHHHGVSDNF